MQKKYFKMTIPLFFFFVFFGFAKSASADTHYVCANGTTCDSGDGDGWSTGNNANACTSKNLPCLTIVGGLGKMAGGDTLIIGDGTYNETVTSNQIPTGSSGTWTKVQAENVHGVLLNGSITISNVGGSLSNPSYIWVDGLKINAGGGAGATPVSAPYASYIKFTRLAMYGADVNGDNTNVMALGPTSEYILVEECWAWGAGRYKFQAYWTENVVFRRNVARHDWKGAGLGSLQCALFNNYDSKNTVWQNNIAIDSDNAYCQGGLYGGWYFENKGDHAADTTNILNGNIVLNVGNGTYAAGVYDKLSGTHTVDNMIIYGGLSGFLFEPGPSVDTTNTEMDTPYASIAHIANLNHWTVGGLTGEYDGRNGWGAGGTGVASNGQADDRFISRSDFSLKNSLLFDNNSCGIADYATSDYNIFHSNTTGNASCNDFSLFRDSSSATIGSHSITTTNPKTNGLLYLPRIESGSLLKTAGEGGTQMGAEVAYKIGTSGTLYGESGWNTLTSDPLWPFPNEDFIKADMASYSGTGAPGVRGFTAGNSIDSSPQTLTKYIWEYLGNQIPVEIYNTTPDITAPSAPSGLNVQ